MIRDGRLAWIAATVWAMLLFTLFAQADDANRIRFAVVGDYQPEIIKRPNNAWHKVFPAMLREMSRFDPKPDFLIVVGDLVNGWGPAGKFHLKAEIHGHHLLARQAPIRKLQHRRTAARGAETAS